MIGVFRYLLTCTRHQETSSRLEALLSPMRDERLMIHEVIKEMIRMGMCCENKYDSGDSQISLAPEAMDYYALKKFDMARLKLLTSRCLAGNLGQQENDANHDFCLHAAWFLAQNPLLPLGDKGEVIAQLRRAFNDDERIIKNNERYDNLRYWMRFLGLGWEYASDKMPLLFVPDPSEYFEMALAELFVGEKRLTLYEFFQRLSRQFPLFPGGGWHGEAQKAVAAMPSPDHLPHAVGFALLRLQQQQQIRLEHLADAPHTYVISEDTLTWNYSYIERLQSMEAR